jgi:hypothetical protein
MGDKSPKSKRRGKAQEKIAKAETAAIAKAKEAKSGRPIPTVVTKPS